jgi:hypothetical protein
LPGYNWGNEDDPNSSSGGPPGISASACGTEVESQAGIYRPICNHQWKLKSTNYGHTKKSQDMDYESILLSGADKMILIYAYHKPFKVQLPNKHEEQNGFNPDNMEAWSGIQMGPEPIKVLVLECKNGAQKGA